jgi:hypothetical protein
MVTVTVEGLPYLGYTTHSHHPEGQFRKSMQDQDALDIICI